jgi:hypothetical protein
VCETPLPSQNVWQATDSSTLCGKGAVIFAEQACALDLSNLRQAQSISYHSFTIASSALAIARENMAVESGEWCRSDVIV